MKIRQNLLSLHRWSAMTLGLIVLVSATTGAGMAFREQLDPIIYPHLATSPPCTHPLSLDEFIQNARRIHPAGSVDYVRVLASPTTPIAVRFLNKDTLYFDRCTGVVAARQNRYGGVFGTLEYIHRGRWAAFGGWVMGLGAITLILPLVGLGLYQWWPRKPRRFAQGLVFNRKLKGPAFKLGLHRTTGAWIAIPLLVSACTGLPNAFESIHDWMAGANQEAHRSVHSSPRSESTTRRDLPLQSAWQTVQQLTDRPSEVLIHVAQRATDPLEIYAIAADAPHPNARTYIYIDPGTGAVLHYTPYRDMGSGEKLYFWMLSWHTGALGVANQLIILAGAIGALLIGYTGIGNYLRRQYKRRSAAARNPRGLQSAV